MAAVFDDRYEFPVPMPKLIPYSQAFCEVTATAGLYDNRELRNDGICSVTATVMDSRVFYGWLTQFGSDIVIEKPASARAAFREHLLAVAAEYGG